MEKENFLDQFFVLWNYLSPRREKKKIIDEWTPLLFFSLYPNSWFQVLCCFPSRWAIHTNTKQFHSNYYWPAESSEHWIIRLRSFRFFEANNKFFSGFFFFLFFFVKFLPSFLDFLFFFVLTMTFFLTREMLGFIFTPCPTGGWNLKTLLLLSTRSFYLSWKPQKI